jgi:fused signal recognition particle receptor
MMDENAQRAAEEAAAHQEELERIRIEQEEQHAREHQEAEDARMHAEE